jgi:hypothetical protein
MQTGNEAGYRFKFHGQPFIGNEASQVQFQNFTTSNSKLAMNKEVAGLK